ncbi:amino acid ABC transporter substrate-binding protein [Actinotalea sp.]|uniref:amino acid ABC transporter substrate-binding protein n=1 Tax=Actinotalea sp. TaxID=1872145 RepID=UPI0035668A27
MPTPTIHHVRRLRTVALALALVSLAAACSSAEPQASSPSGTSSASASDGSLEAVEQAGVIVIGTEGTYRPFSFHEDGTGDLTGYDVEVARAVADRLGVEVRFEETQWDAIFAGLDAGRFDAIANQVSITPERDAAYAFSRPYTYSPGVIVVAADDTSISSFADLSGKKTAQSLTSNWYSLAQQSGATIEPVEGWAQAVALVAQGRVAATVNDELTFLDYKTTFGATNLKVAATTDDVSRNAFAFRRGSTTLVAAVDTALATLTDDGTLERISRKYFSEDVSK